MKKNIQRTYKEKKKVVEEQMAGASYNYLCEKYKISRAGTIANWKKKYLEGTLEIDNRGKRKHQQHTKELEYEILKKSYALLMEIRSKQQK